MMTCIIFYMIIRQLQRATNLTKKMMKFISIDTVKTPNPNFIKLIPVGHQVLGDQGTLDIPSRKYSEVSPLAEELFNIEGVTRVFYGADYLSVAKEDSMEWDLLKPDIYRVVSDYFDSKRKILSDTAVLQSTEINPDDSEVIQFIKQIIASRIRPNLQDDGGDAQFVNFDQQTGILRIKLVGACAGCPSSTATLKGGIEKMLTYYVKQITQVIADDD